MRLIIISFNVYKFNSSLMHYGSNNINAVIGLRLL